MCIQHIYIAYIDEYLKCNNCFYSLLSKGYLFLENLSKTPEIIKSYEIQCLYLFLQLIEDISLPTIENIKLYCKLLSNLHKNSYNKCFNKKVSNMYTTILLNIDTFISTSLSMNLISCNEVYTRKTPVYKMVSLNSNNNLTNEELLILEIFKQLEKELVLTTRETILKVISKSQISNFYFNLNNYLQDLLDKKIIIKDGDMEYR